MVSEGFRLARLVVGLPLELDEHGRGLLQVLVSILGSLEHDGELMAECQVYSITVSVSVPKLPTNIHVYACKYK